MFEIGSSKRVHKSDWRCSGVPFYRARDIEDLSNGFFKSELYIDKKFYEDCKAKYGVPEINDILISAVGTLGKVFVVRDKSPFYYKDGNIICLSNFSNTNPDFIKMLFASSFIEKQIRGGSHGVTVDTYTIIRANQTIIPLPSRSEQDRIVKVWEKCLKELVAINNCKDKITRICSIAKTKILDSFFGENSSYKSYYKNGSLIDDIEIYDNLRKPISLNEREKRVEKARTLYPYFGATGQTGVIDDFILEGEYVLLGEDGAPFLDKTADKAYLVQGKIWVNNHAHVLRSRTNNKFLMYYLNWFDYFDFVSGTTRLKLNQAMMKKIPFPIVSEDIKKKIVDKIERAFAILNVIN